MLRLHRPHQRLRLLLWRPAKDQVHHGLGQTIIARLAQKGMALIAERGKNLAFYEAALLVETGTYTWFDGLVVVSCSTETQLARLIARNGFTREAAAVRIAAQYPLEEKLRVASYIVQNDGDLDQARQEAMAVLETIRSKCAQGEQS